MIKTVALKVNIKYWSVVDFAANCASVEMFSSGVVSLLGIVGSLVMWYFCYYSTGKKVLKQIASNNKRDYLKEKKSFS